MSTMIWAPADRLRWKTLFEAVVNEEVFFFDGFAMIIGGFIGSKMALKIDQLMLKRLFGENRMVTFEEIIEEVLKHEGGYVHDSNDLGGETNFGITKRFYPYLDIKNLTKEGICTTLSKTFSISNIFTLSSKSQVISNSK